MSLQRSLALCPKKKCDKRVLTFWVFNHDVARFNLTKFTLVARPCLVTNPTFSQSTCLLAGRRPAGRRPAPPPTPPPSGPSARRPSASKQTSFYKTQPREVEQLGFATDVHNLFFFLFFFLNCAERRRNFLF